MSKGGKIVDEAKITMPKKTVKKETKTTAPKKKKTTKVKK